LGEVIKMIQEKLFNKKQNVLMKISYKEANIFMKDNHYLGNTPICPVHYGFFEKSKLTCVASFGYLPSPLTPKSIWKNGNNKNTLELRRLSSISKIRNIESHFISLILKELKKNYPNIKMIFSYADTSQNHLGIIYQATNWFYVGKRAGKTYYYLDKFGNKKHSRTINRWIIKKNKKIKNIDLTKKYCDEYKKHLYIMFLGKKGEIKKIKKELKVRFEMYPKLCEGSIKSDIPVFQTGGSGAIPEPRTKNNKQKVLSNSSPPVRTSDRKSDSVSQKDLICIKEENQK